MCMVKYYHDAPLTIMTFKQVKGILYIHKCVIYYKGALCSRLIGKVGFPSYINMDKFTAVLSAVVNVKNRIMEVVLNYFDFFVLFCYSLCECLCSLFYLMP